ncbi:MAG: penicillin-binding protein activator [Planctomycetota bacterium]
MLVLMRSRGLVGKFFGPLVAAFFSVVLAACGSQFGSRPASPVLPQANLTSGEVLSTGTVRVALLLPRSSTGNAGSVAQSFRDAAKLAADDFPNSGVELVVYDTAGTTEGAQTAANKSIAEGSEIILGPLFANNVRAVSPIARQAGIPVVAFSSDASVAAPGVYLLSFLPSDDIKRIVSYSGSQGRRAFAALLPQNAYGQVVEAAFRQSVGSAGGRIVAIERYDPAQGDIATKAAAIATLGDQVDAVLIPDGGTQLATATQSLAAAGMSAQAVRYLGSGQWDDAQTISNPSLAGSWFPAPSKAGFDAFSRRFQSAYGSSPPRNATLAYDATVLAAGLVRQFGGNRFTRDVLTNPNGFNGLDGVFRFNQDGTTERQLAVVEITGSGVRVVSPARQTVAGGS